MHKISIETVKNFCYFDEPKIAIIFKKLLQFVLIYAIIYNVRGGTKKLQPQKKEK
jgi:hypothetical protein